MATDEPVRTDLIDVSGLDFGDVMKLGGSALGRSLKRIKSELEKGQDAIAGFQSAPGQEEGS